MELEGVYADRKYVRASIVVLNEGKSTADAVQMDANLHEQFNDNLYFRQVQTSSTVAIDLNNQDRHHVLLVD